VPHVRKAAVSVQVDGVGLEEDNFVVFLSGEAWSAPALWAVTHTIFNYLEFQPDLSDEKRAELTALADELSRKANSWQELAA
jgi:hypothetical protein